MLIDLNCDMGEGMRHDAELMPLVSSANIACGFHAGDEDTMRRTIELALQHNVAIGAHPGFPDREHFGRTEMDFPEEDIISIVSEQVYQLLDLVFAMGGKLKHVKPHGALYNMSSRNYSLAAAIAKAVFEIDEQLVLFGLSGSESIRAAKDIGLHTANEVFADRTYQDDGSLTPRKQANALITNDETAAQQVLQMILTNEVTSVTGKNIPIVCDTICVHGDGEHAVSFARQINQLLQKHQIDLRSFHP